MNKYNVIIIGAGAAGLSAARSAISNNKSVLVIDMGQNPARKVFISGGGRCNFTNMSATSNKYFGENPEFTKSVLAQVKPTDIIDWVKKHGLKFTEKNPGQFFCATDASDIVFALVNDAAKSKIISNVTVTDIEKNENLFTVHTTEKSYNSDSVIIATGGVSYPNLEVSDFGYTIAKKFGHKIVPIKPGLVGLKTDIFPTEFSGISLPVKIKIGRTEIDDSLLFTHFGIGGPAAYRTSLFDLSNDISINFLPDINFCDLLLNAKQEHGKKSVKTLLSEYLPDKLSKWLTSDIYKNIGDISKADAIAIGGRINNFILYGNELKRRGFDTAEVTMGGVSTQFISSKTMESKLCSGLFFAGEVMDITGDLGGFNLHFAFASGIIAGKNC